MVMAKTFRGPEAERYALALAIELRRDFGLPTYILRTKDFPNRSTMRLDSSGGPQVHRKANLTEPERVRSYDEAAVLVGNEKTLLASEGPAPKGQEAQAEVPPRHALGPFPWRVEHPLVSATRTTNPYVPTQDLYLASLPRTSLVAQMNGGPRSVYHCPGRFTLRVAEFKGRSVVQREGVRPEVRRGAGSRRARSPPPPTTPNGSRTSSPGTPRSRRRASSPTSTTTGPPARSWSARSTPPTSPPPHAAQETLPETRFRAPRRRKNSPVIAPAIALTDLEDPLPPHQAALRPMPLNPVRPPALPGREVARQRLLPDHPRPETRDPLEPCPTTTL